MNIVFFGVFDAVLKITALVVFGLEIGVLLLVMWWCGKNLLEDGE